MSKSGDLEFDNKEKKNLSGNKSNIKKVILIVVGAIFVLFALVLFLVPRIVIYHQAKQVTAELGPAAEYFTEFDLTLPDEEPVREVTFDGMTVTIPGYLKNERSVLSNSCIYEEPVEDGKTGGRSVIIVTMDVSEMNHAIDEMIMEQADGPFKKYIAKQLVKGFKNAGKKIPENYYALRKSCFLLTKEDYSFWDWTQGLAYVIYGLLKNEVAYPCDYTYIYEREDCCGFINVVDNTEQAQSDSSVLNYRVVVMLYNTDDFSTEHVLMIHTDSLETAYAIINSAKIE